MLTVNIVKMMSVQKFITNNDAQMNLSAPSEHLKYVYKCTYVVDKKLAQIIRKLNIRTCA